MPVTTAKPNPGSFFVLVKSFSLIKFIRVKTMMRFKPALGLAATVSVHWKKDNDTDKQNIKRELNGIQTNKKEDKNEA